MRDLARRLLPVVAFVLVLSLVLTGLLSHSRSALTLAGTGQPRTASEHEGVAGRQAGVSGAVGTIPGVGSSGRSGTGTPGRAGDGSSAGPPFISLTVAAKPLPASATKDVPRPVRLLQADVLVVSPTVLPASVIRGLRRLAGVAAAVPVDAGRIKVNGVFVNVLGVDPAAFRPFAARPTAGSTTLWDNIAAGGMAISYTMGSQDRLSLNRPVQVTGSRTLKLPVAGFGTVGIGGVDAVVSHAVAKSLGLPSANAIIVSAPRARLDVLMRKIKKLLPAQASAVPLVTQIIDGQATVTTAAAGDDVAAAAGLGLTSRQLSTFLAAAMSRIGDPYVWGAAGPRAFDCSGLVQWSLAQAGVAMPRVAADQARTGPLLKLTQLRPGDLLFYHTDPTAPNYISHVAIYIGNGWMLQAPETGMDVEAVKADFGAGFAGAIRIYPRIAAGVAASLAG